MRVVGQIELLDKLWWQIWRFTPFNQLYTLSSQVNPGCYLPYLLSLIQAACMCTDMHVHAINAVHVSDKG